MFVIAAKLKAAKGKEKEECIKRDPIPRFKSKLLEMGLISEAEAEEIHKHAVAEVAAVKFALESPFPDLKEVLTDVFA